MQSFINQFFFHHHQNSKNIPKLSNKISHITNITYLTPNNKMYNFFSRKKHLIKVLGLSFLTTYLQIRPLKIKSTTVETFLASSRILSQNFMQNRACLATQAANRRMVKFFLPCSRRDLFSATSLFLFSFPFLISHSFAFKPPTTSGPQPITIQVFEYIYIYFLLDMVLSLLWTNKFLVPSL